MPTRINSDEFIIMHQAVIDRLESQSPFQFSGSLPSAYDTEDGTFLMHRAFEHTLGLLPLRPVHEFYQRHYGVFQAWICEDPEGRTQHHLKSYLFDGIDFFEVPEEALNAFMDRQNYVLRPELEATLIYSAPLRKLLIRSFYNPAYHKEVELTVSGDGESRMVEAREISVTSTR
jgi:hypothetical protein